jgi:hypothetical protein
VNEENVSLVVVLLLVVLPFLSLVGGVVGVICWAVMAVIGAVIVIAMIYHGIRAFAAVFGVGDDDEVR